MRTSFVGEIRVVDALLNNYTIPEGKIYDCKGTLFSQRIMELGREICMRHLDKYHAISQSLDQNEVLDELERLPEGCVACFLLKSTFIGGQKRFEDLFSVYPPKLILQFARRIKYDSGYSYNCAWFIWEKGWRGETTVRWISKFQSEY